MSSKTPNKDTGATLGSRGTRGDNACISTIQERYRALAWPGPVESPRADPGRVMAHVEVKS